MIWDGRKHKLFCARDHFGIKPFYYYHAPGKFFAFATEIKALLCLPEVPREVNEVRIAEFLTSIFDDPAPTFFQGILRLSPGYSLVIISTHITQEPYYKLQLTEELKLESEQDYARRFYEIFNESVRCRMRSIHPLSAMLSGGLDSSSICCIARNIFKTNDQGHLYTVS